MALYLGNGARLRLNYIHRKKKIPFYNGEQLPALPNWDQEAFPYAFIFYSNLDMICFLITFNKKPIAYYPNDSKYLYIGHPDKISYQWWGTSKQWSDRTEPYWVTENTNGYGMSAEKEVWTNHDILNEDGSIFLSAYDYMPVKAENYRLLHFEKNEPELIQVENLYAAILPTSATVHFVENETEITDETAITNKIGDSGLTLKLQDSHLIIEV